MGALLTAPRVSAARDPVARGGRHAENTHASRPHAEGARTPDPPRIQGQLWPVPGGALAPEANDRRQRPGL